MSAYEGPRTAIDEEGEAISRDEVEPGGYELADYIEADAVERLRLLSSAWIGAKDDRYRVFLEGQMFGLTLDMDEHPQWFENACGCETCRSCGD